MPRNETPRRFDRATRGEKHIIQASKDPHVSAMRVLRDMSLDVSCMAALRPTLQVQPATTWLDIFE
jgi:hypothetical protein